MFNVWGLGLGHTHTLTHTHTMKDVRDALVGWHARAIGAINIARRM